MSGKPSLTIEQLFIRYERYDLIRRHDRHIPHPSKAGFVEGFGEHAGLGRSKQSLYNYLEANNLPWPLLPEDEDAFVLLFFGQPPYDITWVNQAVVRAIGQPLDRIIGGRPLELLRNNIRLAAADLATLQRLRADEDRAVHTMEEWLLTDHGSKRQKMRIETRYTGLRTDRFYISATPVAAPYEPETVEQDGFYNVDPDIVVELKRMPVKDKYRLIREQNEGRVLSAYRALQGQAAGRGITHGRVTVSLSPEQDEASLRDLLARLNEDPELLREYMNKHLPPYQPPNLDSDEP